MTEPVRDAPTRHALRPAWKVALYTLVLALGIGAGVGLVAAVASGSIDRDPRHAGELFGRALFPFIAVVTVAAYMIQRSRITRR
jgi:F0F1-type ATP synthase membrane subunit c/vacuolar-type H+-ATPase subunit K